MARHLRNTLPPMRGTGLNNTFRRLSKAAVGVVACLVQVMDRHYIRGAGKWVSTVLDNVCSKELTVNAVPGRVLPLIEWPEGAASPLLQSMEPHVVLTALVVNDDLSINAAEKPWATADHSVFPLGYQKHARLGHWPREVIAFDGSKSLEELALEFVTDGRRIKEENGFRPDQQPQVGDKLLMPVKGMPVAWSVGMNQAGIGIGAWPRVEFDRNRRAPTGLQGVKAEEMAPLVEALAAAKVGETPHFILPQFVFRKRGETEWKLQTEIPVNLTRGSVETDCVSDSAFDAADQFLVAQQGLLEADQNGTIHYELGFWWPSVVTVVKDLSIEKFSESLTNKWAMRQGFTVAQEFAVVEETTPAAPAEVTIETSSDEEDVVAKKRAARKAKKAAAQAARIEREQLASEVVGTVEETPAPAEVTAELAVA